MKKLFCVLCFTVCLLGSSFAQEAENSDYSGGYFGLGLGYSDVEFSSVGVGSVDVDGVVAGAHLGYLFQVDNFVAGVEGGVDISDAQISTSTFFTTTTLKPTYAASFRGRLGAVVNDLLITGHVGVVELELEATRVSVFSTRSATVDDIGFLFGGGIEKNMGTRSRVGLDYTRFSIENFNNSNTDIDVDTFKLKISARF